MALFGIGKKEKKTEEPKVEAVKDVPKKEEKAKPAEKRAPAPTPVVRSGKDISRVLRRPRVTEKATEKTGSGVYVFEVDQRANKKDIADAVERFYKVIPRKINIAKIPSKRISRKLRGRAGVRSGGKKAYVYLKEGDSITIV